MEAKREFVNLTRYVRTSQIDLSSTNIPSKVNPGFKQISSLHPAFLVNLSLFFSILTVAKYYLRKIKW